MGYPYAVNKYRQKFLVQLNGLYPYVKMVGSYKNSREKIKFYCSKCKKEFYRTSRQVLRSKYGCPFCELRICKQVFVKRLSDKFPNIVLVGEYHNIEHKTLFKCLTCGHFLWSFPLVLIRSTYGCQYCAKKIIHDKRAYDVTKFVSMLSQDKPWLSLVKETFVDYNNSLATFVCKKCGTVFQSVPSCILRSCVNGCPVCSKSMSDGERQIQRFLKSHGLSFVRRFVPGDLKDKSNLRYDFKIGNVLIEFQGQQHYRPVDYFGGLNHFRLQQKHDQMKRDWAKDNGFDLVEIRYDQNVDEILLDIFTGRNERR